MANAIGIRTLELRVGCDHRSDTSDEVTKVQVTVTEREVEKEEEREVEREEGDPPSIGLVGSITAIGLIAGMMRRSDRR